MKRFAVSGHIVRWPGRICKGIFECVEAVEIIRGSERERGEAIDTITRKRTLKGLVSAVYHLAKGHPERGPEQIFCTSLPCDDCALQIARVDVRIVLTEATR